MPNARSLAFAFLALATLAVPAPATRAAPPPTAVAPPPGDCTAEPRPDAQVGPLLTRPAATPATPTPIPEGDFAPEQTVAAMEATLHGFLACVNAGDPERAYASLTDRAILRLAAASPDTTPAATPVLGADVDLAEIVLTDGARRFADGRAGMYATIRFPGGTQPERWFFTFVRAGEGDADSWLIDDVTGPPRFPLP